MVAPMAETEHEQDTQHPLHQQAHSQSPNVTGRRRRAAERARALAERKADAMPVVAPTGPRLERHVDADLRAPSPKGGLIETLQQPYLLRLIVRRELAQMYSASILGLLWSYVQPAIRFATYYFVMGVILHMHKDVPFFAIHLFSGMVFVHYFAETFQHGTRSIWENRALVKKMAMPREVFPVAAMLTSIYHTLPQVALLTILCIFEGWKIDAIGVLCLVLGLLLIALLGMSLALLFSALNVFYRDFQNIVGTVNQFLHLMVPMMYPMSRVLDQADAHPLIVQVYLMNPLAEAVLLVQRFFWYGVAQYHHQASHSLEFPPHVIRTAVIMIALAALGLVAAQKIFTRLENKFPERL